MSSLEDHLRSLPEYSATPPARLQFLYSSLAPRKTANPTGFSSALTWWRLTLSDLVAKGLLGDDKLVIVVDDDLRERLRWEGVGRPSSLGTILSELSLTAQVIPLDAYLASSGPASSSWLSLIARPLRWSFSQLRLGVFGEVELGEGAEEAEWKRRHGDWVVRELVERAAANLIPKLADLHADPVSRLYTPKSLQATLGPSCLPGVSLSERDCVVLAKHLSTLNLCAISGDVIKFAAPLSSAPPPLITKSDSGILTLLSTLSSLATHIRSIEARIEEQQVATKAYYEKKQMNLVKSHLVSRKRLEVLLAERVGARDKLGEVLLGIERASGDEETMAALTLGTKTLRTLISSPTLSLSHIDETTSAMSDALADAEDINTAIKEGGVALPSEQEEEVEVELAEMLKEIERGEREERERKESEVRREREEVERREREAKELRVKELQAKLEKTRLEKEEKERIEKEDKQRKAQEEKVASEAKDKAAKEVEALEREKEVAAALAASTAPTTLPEQEEEVVETREKVAAE